LTDLLELGWDGFIKACWTKASELNPDLIRGEFDKGMNLATLYIKRVGGKPSMSKEKRTEIWKLISTNKFDFKTGKPVA
jgi:hypothetical protein